MLLTYISDIDMGGGRVCKGVRQGRRYGAGIGGVRAMQLIQKHGSLEAVMAQLDTARYGVPDPFPFSEARTLFKGTGRFWLPCLDAQTCRAAWLRVCLQ